MIEMEEFGDPRKEFEDMENSKLLSKDYAKNIMLFRRIYQYGIEQSSLDLDKFREYIRIEQSILNQVKDAYNEETDILILTRIVRNIVRRIGILYENALLHFPTDTDLLEAFIMFCKNNGEEFRVNNIIAEMFVLKPDNIQIWLTFANWHLYDCQNINAAMNMLLKGIEIHINNTVLYIELIKILLNFWSEHEKLTNENVSEHTKRMEEIMLNTFNNVNDLNFYIELLGVLEKEEFTGKIQEMIVSHMKMKYREDVLVWHTLAQKYYKGFYADNDRLMQFKANEGDMVVAQWLVSCETYITGLDSVPLENKKEMYELYLEFLFNTEIYGDIITTYIKTNTLNKVLNDCHGNKYLSEKHYIQWAEYDKRNAINIYENGIRNLHKAPHLRLKHLDLLIIKNTSSAIENAFNEGIQVLQEESLPLWLSFIRYHSSISSENRLEEIYKQAIQQAKEVSNVLKPEYLD